MVEILPFSKEAPTNSALGTNLVRSAWVVASCSSEPLEDLLSANIPRIS